MKTIYFQLSILLFTFWSCAKQESEALSFQQSFKSEDWQAMPILNYQTINMRLSKVPNYGLYDLDRDYRKMKYNKEKSFISGIDVISTLIERLKMLESGDNKLIAYYVGEMGTWANMKPSHICRSLNCLKGNWSEKRINQAAKKAYDGIAETLKACYSKHHTCNFIKEEEFAYWDDLSIMVASYERTK